MVEKYTFKKLTTEYEISEFWNKKREYETNDIFPNVKETGKDLEELIQWFESKEYYDIIMNLHNNFPEGGSGLQFVFIYENIDTYIGFIMYKIYTQEDGKCFILDFSIDSKYRNKGIGSQVVEAFENFVKAYEGATYFVLNTSNENNRRFWMKQDYLSSEIDDNGEVLYFKK